MSFFRVFRTILFVLISLAIIEWFIGFVHRQVTPNPFEAPSSAEVKQMIEEQIAGSPLMTRGAQDALKQKDLEELDALLESNRKALEVIKMDLKDFTDKVKE